MLIILFPAILYSQPVYQKLKVYGTRDQIQMLLLQGVCMDHGHADPGVWYSSYFNPDEAEIIRKSGLKYDVIIPDAAAHYAEQNQAAFNKSAPIPDCTKDNAPLYSQPAHFKYGSMGGFYTYAQLLADLDSMALLYPNLITVKQPAGAGLTWDGNEIYYVKISDNPSTSEPEPQVYYSALHHAREPLSMQQLIYYMWYLLENYQTDSLVKYIVDNRELYFIPCLNPDGYLYNELTNPSGGGLWRKNRRDNQDGTFGVDLNRNYDIFWGFDNTGSSPFTASETYRGPFPFSEPETQIVSGFINSHQFVTALDFHTYGDHLLYPWSHVPDTYTPDSAVFVNLAEAYTQYNDYSFGTCNQTLNYIANGGSFDWLYGEQSTKPKIFDFTPECGYDFWPAQNDILEIVQGAIHMDVMSALVAGKYAKLYDKTTPLLAGVNGFIKFDLIQLGLDTTGSYTVSLAGLSAPVSSTGPAKVYSNLSYLETITDSISFALNAAQINGTELKFLLTVDFGSYQVHDTLTKFIGIPVVIVSDSGNNMSTWASGSSWGLTASTFYSPGSSITDSPLGDYQDFEFNELVIANPVNLLQAVKAGLSFYCKWHIETSSDFVQVSVSDDGGITWWPLCGKYTRPGTWAQDPAMPIYDGVHLNWLKEEISLDEYVGKNILIRFILVSDNFSEFDGFYFDDFVVWSVGSNVGMPEENENAFIADIVPNPASETATVHYRVAAAKSYSLTVINALGQRVSTVALDPQETSYAIDLKDFKPGIYTCLIEDGTRVMHARKLVVAD